MTLQIKGTGSAFPATTLTNDDLAKNIDTSDEWIASRTGIRSRRIVNQTESAVTLAVEASQKALDDAKMKKEEIDLVLVATCSAGVFFPSVACQVQAALGLEQAVAFDISAACSGFLFALHTAHAYASAGEYQNILVVGTETMSRVIDWNDRGTCVLFGDGAGACVLQKSDVGIKAYVQKSNGAGGQVLTGKGGALPTPLISESEAIQPLYMNGQEVFRFAVKTVPECVQEVLAKSDLTVEDVDHFVLHQANSRIIESVAKRLKAPLDKFAMNLDTCGNTSAASIPILLDEMNKKGKLKSGDKIILSGFGAGLTWAATLIEW